MTRRIVLRCVSPKLRLACISLISQPCVPKFQVPGKSSLRAACVEQVLSIIGSREPRHMLPRPCFMGPRNSPVGQKDSVFLHTFLFHGSHGKPICMSQM
jgi:hypothetical protein